METKTSILSPEECAQIIKNLDQCLAHFEKKSGLLTVAELRIKSLLSVVRGEVARGQAALLSDSARK